MPPRTPAPAPSGLQQQPAGYTYTLPGSEQAAQGMRDLQTQAVGGLSDLMAADYDANRQTFQDAMYAGQEEAITRAMKKQFNTLAEGQFARGVGQSSSTENLISDLNREYMDSLSRAQREAYLAAGGENRADLAARSGLMGLGFNAGTTGLQAEANVGLNNAARLQHGAAVRRPDPRAACAVAGRGSPIPLRRHAAGDVAR